MHDCPGASRDVIRVTIEHEADEPVAICEGYRARTDTTCAELTLAHPDDVTRDMRPTQTAF